MSIIISGGGGGGGGGATTLNGLSDVNITSVANGQIIAYNNASGNWENQTGITGGLTYKGAFNATTGSPSLLNAVQGDFYVVDTAGTIYGQTWNVGDHLLINSDMGGVIDNAKIDKVDNTDQVISVNGQTGAVTGLLEAGNNLSDLTNVPTARSNLSLGAAATANDTDGVPEGAANLYFTDARADARVAAADLTDLSDVSYTAGPGIDNFVLTFDNATSSWGAEAAPSAPVDSVNGATGTVVLDTDDVAEGAANLYFTDARADARIAAADLTDLSDVSYTAGPAIDNYVLTYDNATSTWGAEAATGGGSRPTVYNVSADTTIGTDTAISSSELERVYIVDSSAAVRTMTLPQITGNVGDGYKIQIKRDGGNNVVVTANGADRIENGSAGGSETLSVDKSSFTLVCADNPSAQTNWYII